MRLKAIAFLFVSLCHVAFAVPLEMIYTGQVSAGDGQTASLDFGASATQVGGVRVTFWDSAWAGGAAPQAPPGTERNVTLLSSAAGAALTVTGTFLTNCAPGGSFSFTSCLTTVTNDAGVFQTNLYLSLTDFDVLFQDGAPVTYVQIERVFVDINTGAVTSVHYYPRQRFTTAPYCLKVPIDTTTMSYVDGKLTLANGAITGTHLAGGIADTKLAQITTAGKVNGSAVSGTIGNATSIDTSGNINTTGSLTVNGVSVTTGAGITGYLPKWTGPRSFDNSSVYESGGKVGIGTSSPAAILDISSTTSGFLPPRLTTAQRDAIGLPVAGMTIYNISSSSLEVYNGNWWSTAGQSVPMGAIMAFAATSCPTGWTEYTAARGRFLRGIDNGAGIDPDGTRAPGHVQGDELGSHAHTISFPRTSGAGGGATAILADNIYSNVSTNTSYINAAASGGAETRPKNVAVLYCQYSGGAPAPIGANQIIQGGSSVTVTDASGVAIAAGGAERISVANSGNVGIGTTTPSAKLHIAGTAGVDGIKFPDGTTQTTAATISSGFTTLATTFQLAATTAWQATGVSVSLPSAGTYLLTMNASGDYGCSAQYGRLFAKLYNSTDGADIPGAKVTVVSLYDETQSGSGSSTVRYVTSAAKTIELHAKVSCTSSTTRYINGDDSDSGNTSITWVRLGP